MTEKRNTFLEQELAKYNDYLAKFKLEPDGDKDLFSQGLSSEKQKIRAWQVSTETGYFMRDLIVTEKPNNILEIGTSMGYSTAFIGWGNEMNGNHAHIITNDISHEKISRSQNFHLKLELQNIEYVTGDTIGIIKDLNKVFDVIFFDGYKPAYTEYFTLLEKKWSTDGVIIVDNAGDFPDRMKDFLIYLDTRNDIDARYVAIGDGLLEIRRGVKTEHVTRLLVDCDIAPASCRT